MSNPTDPQRVTCQLRMPDQAHFFEHITENAAMAYHVAEPNSRVGKSVVICGAGPSLRDECRTLPESDEVWACNSALPYLMDRGVRVTHGFAIDQGEAMLGPNEWQRTFDVTYLIASSVSPNLTRHLIANNRRVEFFHNYLGIENPPHYDGPCYEIHLYTESGLYGSKGPTGKARGVGMTGHGLNSVPRAVCLAVGMGFSRIIVLGADCGVPDQPAMPPMGTPEYADWMDTLPMYADGRTAGQCWSHAQPIAEAPNLNGRRWHTRPDMIVSAMHLLEIEATFAPRVEIVGDVLPNALRGQSSEFMDHLPTLQPDGTITGFGNADTHTMELVA